MKYRILHLHSCLGVAVLLSKTLSELLQSMLGLMPHRAAQISPNFCIILWQSRRAIHSYISKFQCAKAIKLDHFIDKIKEKMGGSFPPLSKEEKAASSIPEEADSIIDAAGLWLL